MKRAMIYAYTANNLGDDLFIYLLCKRYKNTQFSIYAPARYKETFKGLKNLRVIPSDRFIERVFRLICRLLRKEGFREAILAKKHDVGIYIGGSLFRETSDWEKTWQRFRTVARIHEHFFILGANFGPYKSERFFRAYEALFKQCTDVCFREQKSLNLFKHLQHARFAPDIVFQLQHKAKKTTNKVIISVIYPSLREHLKHVDVHYFKLLSHITIGCINEGQQVCFMSFCNRENDHIAISKITDLIPEKYLHSIEIYHYEDNIHEALSLIAAAKAIVATRFHAMIIGWVMKKPVYPIIYSEKMINVIQESHFQGQYIDLRKAFNEDEIHLHDILQQPSFSVAPFVKESEKHFSVLDRYLHDE